jgi:hypothetical protein
MANPLDSTVAMADPTAAMADPASEVGLLLLLDL